MSCRAKFGVSFHGQMNIEDIVYLWCKRVTPEIKAAYPEINDLINAANVALSAIREVRSALIKAQQALEAVKAGVMASAAFTGGQAIALAGAIAGKEAQDLAMGLAADAVSGVSVQITGGFTCSDEVFEEPKYQSQQNDLDKIFSQLTASLELNLCNQ